MSVKEAELPEREADQNQRGVILGYWDHEKTPTLIQDLEHSVDAVERKCKNLLEELIYYKKYLEESEDPQFHRTAYKKKNKKSENSNSFTGSDPDIAFRKNLINLQETQQIFEEKFQAKLVNINNELRAAAQKLGLNDSIILFPMDEYLKNLTTQTEDKVHKIWNDVRDKFIKMNRFKRKTGSDSVITDIVGKGQYSKITRKELELYQRLSRLSLKKPARVGLKARKLLSKGRKIKFCRRKISPAFCQEPRISKSTQKTPKRRRKTVSVAPRSPRTSSQCLCPPGISPPSKDPLEFPTGCKSVADALKNCGEKLPLGLVIKQCVPFTTCTSTSRSYNIGLNMQQLLSLSRRMRNSRVTQGKQEEERSRSWKGVGCGDVEKRRSLSWIPGAKGNGFESEEVRRLEQDGKVWVSKRHTSSDFRKVRSRYTGSSPGGVMEYHKSTMSQYTNGQKSMIKSESKSAYAVGSKIMVSGCERTDVFEIDKDEGLLEQASGDGSCNDKRSRFNMEWTKVYGAFLSTYKKYMSLKEKLSDSEAEPSNDELISLETEIDHAIEKYKDFLQFYSKFLHLKHRLKSLKIACETKTFGPMTALSSNTGKKAYACRPTYSMAVKKAFKEIQALHDSISLISD